MSGEFDPVPGQEQFWLKRAEASYSMIQTWGTLVFKMLTALHSGSLITMAALYTDKKREFACIALAETSMGISIIGLFFTVVGLMSAYFNGLYHFPEAEARLKSIWSGKPEERLAEQESAARNSKLIGAFLVVAIVFVVASTAAFFGSVVIALWSL